MHVPDGEALVRLALLLGPAMVLLLQVTALLGGGDGWAFCKSVGAFLFGMLFGGALFTVLSAFFYVQSCPLPLLLVLIMCGGLLFGLLSMRSYWRQYYANVVALPALLTVLTGMVVLHGVVGVDNGWVVLILSLIAGVIGAAIYWQFYLRWFPLIWVGSKTVLITGAAFLLATRQVRYTLAAVLGKQFFSSRSLEAIGSGQLAGHLMRLLIEQSAFLVIVALTAAGLTLYAIYIQQFTRRWRELVNHAKTHSSDPQGGIVAGGRLTVESIRRTLWGMVTFQRMVVHERGPARSARPARPELFQQRMDA